MFDAIKRVSVVEDSSGRLVATVTGEDIMGNAVTGGYRTNREGDGLWAWNSARRDWQQTHGTCQFNARTPAMMRRKLRAMLAPKAPD